MAKPAPAQASFTILVADDDPDVHAIAKTFFGSKGQQVISAWNGVECLTLARSNRPDVILLDLRMPLMDGLDVTRQLKADTATRDIPIMAVTGAQDLGAEAIVAGCEAFVTKPITPSEMFRRIKELMDQLANQSSGTT
jgi:CheY-like chemotaxis protein